MSMEWRGAEALLASDSHQREQRAADLAVGLSEAVVFLEVVRAERKSPAGKSSHALQRVGEDGRLALEFRAVLVGRGDGDRAGDPAEVAHRTGRLFLLRRD